MSGSEKITITAAHGGSKVVRFLRENGVKVQVKPLEVGDFQLSDRVCVERKSATDFLRSIVDKRLFRQILNMCERFERPVLMIEGRNLYGMSNLHPNAIRGAISFVAVMRGVPVIFTRDYRDTAYMLMTIARQEQIGLKGEISFYPKRKAETMADRQRYIVQTLPRIGPVVADRLLKHFKTLQDLFAASREKLMEVENVGYKRAKEIREILEAAYPEKE